MTKSTRKTDIAVTIISVIVIAISAWWLFNSGAMSIPLDQDPKLSWHLVRSAGIFSYVLLLASTIWGLFISGQIVKDWSPGPVSMTLHATVSWLAVILGLGHGLLLMLDDYFTYTLSDILVPFTGPYRPEVVGLGTLAFWLLLIISLSFPFKKHMGHKLWLTLHLTSYVAFGMVTLHGLFAGTDSTLLGFRILISVGVLSVLTLLVIRMRRDRNKAHQRQASRRAVRQQKSTLAN